MRYFVVALSIAALMLVSSLPTACSKKARPVDEAADEAPAGASPTPKHGRPSGRLVDTTGPATATSPADDGPDAAFERPMTTSQAATQVATTPELKAMAEKYGIIVSDIFLKAIRSMCSSNSWTPIRRRTRRYARPRSSAA